MAATREIKQTVRIKAAPAAIYRALMESRRDAAFTGAPARIDPKIGGRIAAWGPHIRGVNIELVRNRRIVQAWRTENWPKGHYSIARFELARVPGGARLTFTQTGVPAKHAASINSGWKSHYWALLKKALERRG